MICKWCGAALKPGAKACPRCRREVPALSDCGGFYDLVPQARDIAPAEPEPAVIHPSVEEMPFPAPEEAVQPIRPVLPPKRKKKNAWKNVVFWLAVVLAAVLLLQVISLSSRLENANDLIQQLRSREDSGDEKANQGGSKPNVKPNPLPSENPTSPEKPDDDQDARVLTGFYDHGESTLDFSDKYNELLNSGAVTVALEELSGETVATITLELQSGEDGSRQLYLEVSADWKNLSFVWEDSEDEEHTLKWWNASTPEQTGNPLFPGTDGEGENTEAPQYTGSVLDIDWDKKTELNCTVMGMDGEGNEIKIILTGIVIE